MKKLLFTVFAVVGFGTVASANNLEVKKLQVKTIIFYNCMQDQEAAFDECMSNGCGYWTSYFYGAGAWGSCMRG
ncbi:hypothetical protein ACWA1F_01530 [Flavobacterium sp. 3-218]